MADEDLTPESEEEYQFSDLESPDVYTAPEDVVTTPDVPEGPRKAVMLAVAVLVVFGVYKALGLFTKPTKVAKAPAPVEEVVVVPEPTAFALIATTDGLSQQDATRLGSELGSLRSAMTSIDTKLASINTMLQKLSILSREQEKRLNLQQAHIKSLAEEKKKKKVVKKQEVKRKMYVVQAIVPGRAWLKDEAGAALTVSRGDKIAGYGAVSRVDAPAGRVVMTTGDVLRFGPDDR